MYPSFANTISYLTTNFSCDTIIITKLWRRDGFGDTSVLGDLRWGGAYGVEATFIAMDTVNISYIFTK